MVSKVWKEQKRKEFEEIKKRQEEWDTEGYKKGKVSGAIIIKKGKVKNIY